MLRKWPIAFPAIGLVQKRPQPTMLANLPAWRPEPTAPGRCKPVLFSRCPSCGGAQVLLVHGL
eukprot:8388164-Karenia_brevis.AAC.1